MIETIVFVIAHALMGLLARFWFTDADFNEMFTDGLGKTAIYCLVAIAIGFALWFAFPVR